MEKLPDDITQEQKEKVEALVTRYDDIFFREPFDMGRTNLVEHSIDTGNNRPIRQALRRHPRAHLDIIDQQVNELLDNDFIEPAAGPLASNVVLVRKKDGSHRLCVDYRAVNSVTYKDTYPLPHIDTCLGSMDGAVWFSTLDLRSGYHAIPMAGSVALLVARRTNDRKVAGSRPTKVVCITVLTGNRIGVNCRLWPAATPSEL